MTLGATTMNLERSLLTLAAGLALGWLPAVAEQPSSYDPAALVRETVRKEVNASTESTKVMFRDQKVTTHGSQTRLIIETHEGTAGMLIAIDGKPLTTQQRQGELERLERLANNPQELKKKQKAERDDADRTMRIVKALPDAFLYEPDGTEPEKPELGKPGDGLLRLKFRPNPNYDPPTRTEQVLTGMQGYILIDAKQHRIAKIDGTLFKDVGFGWGILGHLDKGGRFLVTQKDLGDGDWEVTRMDLDFTGRALFFKKIGIQSNEVVFDYHTAPDVTFAQAVELLKKEESELAANGQLNNGDPPK